MNTDLGNVPEIVANAWHGALGIERPALERSFLALGGDSLRASLLRNRLLGQLGVAPPLASVLTAESLAALTAHITDLLHATPPPRGATAPLRSPEPALSFAQERMWFLHELAAATAAYHVTQALRLRGPLDPAALQAAFEAVTHRHEVLTAAFSASDGAPRPARGRAASPTLRWVELREPESQRLAALHEFLTEFANAPFNLESGPMLRSAVIHVGPDDAVMAIVMHHIVGDQWSLDLFWRDLALAYAQSSAGEPVEFDQPAPRLSEYAAAHREWFQRERHGIETRYWQEKLRGLEPLTLNEDFLRPPLQSFRGARLRFDFGLRDIAALRSHAARRGATLSMLLLAALKVLLMRHTGRTDVAVGVPVANRHRAESEGVFGTLINTLVIRTELDGAADFSTLLERERDTLLEALEHQDMPFELLVQELNLPRDASRSPLFSVMLNMLNTPLDGLEFPRLEWSRLEFDREATQFDLQISVDAEHARSISFEYATDIFAEATVRRFADQYFALLRAIVRDPSCELASIDLMPEAELQTIKEWARGPRTSRAEGTLPQLLFSALEQGGARIAVRFEDESLTYAELAAAVMRVAIDLRSRGIARGALVGLCLQRSVEMLVAQLAVLGSGAAYVPLDPAYPADRLAFMARDSGLSLLLHDDSLPPAVDWPDLRGGMLHVAHALRRDQGRGQWNADPTLDALPNDPAYVIYTSGSTGQPKGVVVPHRAVVNFLRSMAYEPGLSSADRLLAITTLSFDIAVLELLLPLAVGAQLVIASQSDQVDGEALRQLIMRRQITVMQATPSTWRLMIESGWSGTPGLRALVGGETLTRELAIQLLGRCAEVWNMYGPTETTVWSTCAKVHELGRELISIGRPIANTEVLVLDPQRRICPIGVAGEICIGGDGVALGYLGREDLTSERFIANPYSRDRRTTRLYRTGDRGRWRRDGLLEHLGRLDTQIKIRGHRIELGEIEARIAQHPGVAAAVVVAHPDSAGDARIAAYFVVREHAPALADLREHLRQWLPDYMQPQLFMQIERVPLLPNGKVDRASLPAPRFAAEAGSARVEPRTVAEMSVWQVWRELLGTDQFGVTDDFFELGGHSLLAVRMVRKLREELQRACTLPMVFRHPTIAALCVALTGATPLSGPVVIPLRTAGKGPALFCLCGIQIYQALADALAPQLPVLGVFVPQEMEFLRPDAALNDRTPTVEVGSSRVDLQACKLEYSIVSPK